MATVVDVLARLRADSSGMVSGFGQAERAAKGFSTRTIAIGSAIGMALGTVVTQAAFKAGHAMVSFVGDSVNAARDMNETVSKVGVIFGDQAKEIEKFAATAATALGLSKQAAMDGASTFAVFGKSAGLAGTNLTGFATELTGLSADLASFYNTSPEDAIVAIGSALRGESEPIRKYGILLDDATLRQQALSLGIISTTKQALTPQQRVLAAQAAILKQTSDAQGDFARTSDGLANQQRILSAQIQNVKTTFGQALLPVVLQVTSAFNTKVIPAMQAAGEWAKSNLAPALSNVVTILKQMATVVVAVGKFFLDHKGILVAVGATLAIVTTGIVAFNAAMKIQQSITRAVTAVTTLYNVAQFLLKGGQLASIASTNGLAASMLALNATFLANPIVLIVALIAALAVGLVIAYKKSETFRNIVQGAMEGVKKAFSVMLNAVMGVFNWLKQNWKGILLILVPPIAIAVNLIMSHWETIKRIFSTAFEFIKGVIARGVGYLKSFGTAIGNLLPSFDSIKQAGITAFNGLMTGIGFVVNGIISIFNGLISAWNKVPFHDDIPLISKVTMPQLGKAVDSVGKKAQGSAISLAVMASKTKNIATAAKEATKATTAATAATTANTKAAEAAAAQASKDADTRSAAVASMKEMLKVQFGQPSELRKALSGSSASVDSIIATYSKLEQAINDRFAGLNKKGADKMIAFLQDQTSALVKLATARESVVKELEKAQQKLQDVINARLDYSNTAKSALTSFGQSLSGFFSDDVAAISKKDLGVDSNGVRAIVTQFGKAGAASADEMAKTFRKRLETVKLFAGNIKKLAGAGLNKDLITQLIGLAPEEGAAVAQSILDGGAGSIDALNAINAELLAVASDFGTSLATTFYGQAQSQAQEYLNGWQSKLTAIDAAMATIASGIETQLKFLTQGTGSIGMAAMDNLIAGLKSREAEAIALANSIAAKIAAALSAASAGQEMITAAAASAATIAGQALIPAAAAGAPPAKIPSNPFNGLSGAESTHIAKGAVIVTITNNGGDPYDQKLSQMAVAATKRAMEEALIKAAKVSASSRRMAVL